MGIANIDSAQTCLQKAVRPTNELDDLLICSCCANIWGAHPEVTEVILSVGDPLILPASRLAEIIEWIRSVPSVKSIRIHTRAIVYEPKAFTAEKVDIFAEHNVRIVLHIVHHMKSAKTLLEGGHNS